MNTLRFALVLAAAFAGSPAFAHSNAGAGASFLSGLAHPFTGADHLLAMVAVGLWASLLGRRALILLPLSFLVTMLVGGVVAMSGVSLPLAETGILLSIPVFWGAFAFGFRPPIVIGVALCAIFAFAHGFAHGAELTEGGDAILYSIGFLLATALLLLFGGFVAGRILAQARTAWRQD